MIISRETRNISRETKYSARMKGSAGGARKGAAWTTRRRRGCAPFEAVLARLLRAQKPREHELEHSQAVRHRVGRGREHEAAEFLGAPPVVLADGRRLQVGRQERRVQETHEVLTQWLMRATHYFT